MQQQQIQQQQIQQQQQKQQMQQMQQQKQQMQQQQMQQMQMQQQKQQMQQQQMQQMQMQQQQMQQVQLQKQQQLIAVKAIVSSSSSSKASSAPAPPVVGKAPSYSSHVGQDIKGMFQQQQQKQQQATTGKPLVARPPGLMASSGSVRVAAQRPLIKDNSQQQQKALVSSVVIKKPTPAPNVKAPSQPQAVSSSFTKASSVPASVSFVHASSSIFNPPKNPQPSSMSTSQATNKAAIRARDDGSASHSSSITLPPVKRLKEANVVSFCNIILPILTHPQFTNLFTVVNLLLFFPLSLIHYRLLHRGGRLAIRFSYRTHSKPAKSFKSTFQAGMA